jgi:Flp pilus assembly protein TadB
MKKLLAACVIAAMFVGLGASVGLGQEKQKSAEERFKAMDKNADNKLSEAEYVGDAKDEKAEKAKTRFARMDTNNDKSLSLEEYVAGTKKKDK